MKKYFRSALKTILAVAALLPAAGCALSRPEPPVAPDAGSGKVEAPAYPAYLKYGLTSLRADRWKTIPEDRQAEFSFNTVKFPFQEPDNPHPVDTSAWSEVQPGLRAAFVSLDRRFFQGVPPPEVIGDRVRLSGWRGERVAAQILLWTRDGLLQARWNVSGPAGSVREGLPEDCVSVNFMRYVLSDDGSQGGRGAPPDSVFLSADVLDDIQRFDMPAMSVRPLWVSVNIPGDAGAGTYEVSVGIEAEGCEPVHLSLEIEVLPRTLPPPGDWHFQLDLWQNPWAVARYHRVRPWSDEHWALLEPLYDMLAAAGQKYITAVIVSQPWAGQTYDAYESMIAWTRKRDGSWSYDYSVFDSYVRFCMDRGISGQISCYSMLSWSGYTYYDEASGNYQTLSFKADSPEYSSHWTPFLRDFASHLRDMGWYERTVFAIDEAPLENMQQLISFIRKDAPGLKIGLGGDYFPELNEDIFNWCFFIDQPVTDSVLAQRSSLGRPSTYYVCCGPERPNTFVFSPPYESTWLGWYAAARGFDGVLRWAFNSWPLDPLVDARYISWPAGDCFMVYPGARSSVRFERLREGIQDYEKIRILRSVLSGDNLRELETYLDGWTYDPAIHTGHYASQVNGGKELLRRLSLTAP